MMRKTDRPHPHLILYFSVFIVFYCFSCTHTGLSGVARQKEKLVDIPTDWRSSVILLQNRTELVFQAHNNGNRVKRKDTLWAYVKKRNPNYWEHIAEHDNEFIEKPIKIDAEAYYPDGSHWKLDSKTIKREKIPFSNEFINEFNIPRYDEGVIIRLETRREYLQPEFFGRFQLRDENPALSRSIAFTFPQDCDLAYGLENPEELNVEQSLVEEGGKKKIEINVRNLGDTWSWRKTEFPEQWYAAFYVSFPPKGKHSYSWKELGDHYLHLQLSNQTYASSPEIQALAGLVKGSTQAELIQNSFDTIVRKIRYHADEEGRFAFFPRKASTILKNGYGDCKEISTLLKTLLQAYKVTAYPALIATANHCQPVEKYPSLSDFNHVILATGASGSNYQFLDGTETWGKAGNSYYDLICRTAFVIKPGGSHLVLVTARNDFQNRIVTHARVTRTKKETPWTLKGDIQLIGYPALQFFRELNWSDTAEKKSLAKLFLQKQFGIYPSSVDFNAPDSASVTLSYEALFQENYIAMEKGGFRLAVPGLYAAAADNSLEQYKGPRQLKPFEQQDTWEFDQNLQSSRFNDFHLAFADCAYTSKGNTITRRYRQKDKLFQEEDSLLETWTNSLKSTLNSTCWR